MKKVGNRNFRNPSSKTYSQKEYFSGHRVPEKYEVYTKAQKYPVTSKVYLSTVHTSKKTKNAPSKSRQTIFSALVTRRKGPGAPAAGMSGEPGEALSAVALRRAACFLAFSLSLLSFFFGTESYVKRHSLSLLILFFFFIVCRRLFVWWWQGTILLSEGGYDFLTLSIVFKSLDSDCEIIPSWTPKCHRIIRTKVWKYDFG